MSESIEIKIYRYTTYDYKKDRYNKNYNKNHNRTKDEIDIAEYIKNQIKNNQTKELEKILSSLDIIYLEYCILKIILRDIEFVREFRNSEDFKFLLRQDYDMILGSNTYFFNYDEFELYDYLIKTSNGSLKYDFLRYEIDNHYYSYCIDKEIWFLLKYYTYHSLKRLNEKSDMIKMFINDKYHKEDKFLKYLEEFLKKHECINLL